MSNERYLVGFMPQVKALSSGTLCNLTGYSKYTQIDKVRASFEDYCYNTQEKYESWMDAWNDFKDVVDLKEVVGE